MRQVRNYGHRERVALHITEPSMTEQHHAMSCDVNHIIKRFQATGQLPPGNAGQYLDAVPFQRTLQERIHSSQEIISGFAEAAASLDEAPPPTPAPVDPVQPAP